MRAAMWTRENLAWLAGILEGEGCFLIMRRGATTAFRVTLQMTDVDVVRHAAAIGGVGHVRGPVIPANPKHTPYFGWNVNRRADIYALLAAVYPYMGARRQGRIRDIMELFATTGQRSWRHGTRQGYEQGCRCADCTAANTERCRAQRAAA